MDDTSETERQIKCSYCEKRQQMMKLCSRCRANIYCSRDCQVKDWANHKKQCSGKIALAKDSDMQEHAEKCLSKDRKEESTDLGSKIQECTKLDCEYVGTQSSSEQEGNRTHGTCKLICPDRESNGSSFETNSKLYVQSEKENHGDIQLSKSSKEDANITIFIKQNKLKSKLELKNSNYETLFHQVSNFVRIPPTKLKLVHKGTMVTPENIPSFAYNGAVFLALGEVSECEDGIDKGDIETLMKQLNVERNIAVRALKKTGTLLDAIFDVGNDL